MTGMGEFRKITVQVPEGVLEKAQAYTGAGVTQTVTAALKRLASIHAQQELLKLRGKVRFALTPGQLREERD